MWSSRSEYRHRIDQFPQWLRREEFAAAIRLGKDLLDRELKRARRSLPTSAEALKTGAAALGHPDFDHVYEALGRGDIWPTGGAREPSPLAKLAAKLRLSGRGVRIANRGLHQSPQRHRRQCPRSE